MKREKNILIAFLLNLCFSVFELVGGVMTGSVAISSDAVHDLGDAISIGVSYCMERKSRKEPNETYTYGYARYSVLGGVVTTLILFVGSFAVALHAIWKITNPTEIQSVGMILFAVVGVVVNFCAAYFTRSGNSVNQRAVNLHMLEDVLGWAVVLVGGIVIRFTGFVLLDPILSIGVALFILINAGKNLNDALGVLLEKVPMRISPVEITEHLMEMEGIEEVHHIHIWSLDGEHAYATMHLVTDGEGCDIKEKVRNELRKHGISHATLELESLGEQCHERECLLEAVVSVHHCHHH